MTLSLLVSSYYFDFGRGLNWVIYTQPSEFLMLTLRLLFLSLLVERVVEFYVLIFWSKHKKFIENKITTLTQNGDVQSLERFNNQLIEFRAETRVKTALVGFCVGIFMALAGIRIFTNMFEFEDASTLQILLFDMFELVLMGALMAGGSKGINKVLSAIECFSKTKTVQPIRL